MTENQADELKKSFTFTLCSLSDKAVESKLLTYSDGSLSLLTKIHPYSEDIKKSCPQIVCSKRHSFS